MAAKLLQSHLLVADSTAPFPYAKSDMKKGIKWPGIWKHRLFLNDLLDATEGRMLRQKRWGNQLASFVAHQNIHLASEKVEAGAYNVRVMLSHIRIAKLKKLRPPQQYAALRALLNKMQLDEEGPPACNEVAPLGGMDNLHHDDDDDDDVVFIPAAPKAPSLVVEVGSGEEQCQVDMSDLDLLSQEVFQSKGSTSSQAIGGDEMDTLVLQCDAKAPLPTEYKTKFTKPTKYKTKFTKVMKKTCFLPSSQKCEALQEDGRSRAPEEKT